MGMTDVLDKYYEDAIQDLTTKEKIFFRKLKQNVLKLFNNIIRPLMIALATFWLFTRIKDVVGIEEVIFIQITVVIILLRSLNAKLG